MWQYHDSKMRELKKIYLKTSKQTQNRIQELIDTFSFTNETIFNIADTKTKNRVNSYIEEWKDKGLLTGYFGMLANNIYKRTRVKNSEILELLIYGAYIEEQSKLEETELNIFKEEASYYYQQGQEEVKQAINEKKIVSVIPDAIFLALLDTPNVKGWTYNQYIQTILRYNAEQIYRQYIIDLQQQKESDISNDIYQNIINKQQNNKLCINANKISGEVDLTLIGINNMAKAEGIASVDNNAKVIFLANIDGNETEMCHSLNNQEFYIHKENEFDRYYGETQKDLAIRRVKCKGLVLGLNLPPISHHFHYCRSMIQYIPPRANKENDIESNLKKRLRSVLNKNLLNYNTKNISKIALIQNLINGKKVIKDFPVLNNKIKNIKIRNNKDYSMAIKPLTNTNGFNLYINKDVFKTIKNARQEYEKLIELGEAPKGTSYKDILIHELGHGVTYEIIKKKYNGDLNLIDNDWCNSITSTEIVNKAFKNIGINDYKDKYKTISNLSTYSLDNASETIGEAFIDYYSNGSESQKISKEIIKIMKGMI